VELAILFWCYKEAEVCANRLRLLRHYNPSTPIYVLFGGEPAEAQRFETEFHPYVNDFYVFSEGKSPQWKWKHGDMLISRWFSERGYQLKWDSIAIIQWDMLVFAPVEKLFGHLKKNELLLSGARPVEEVKAWWGWVQPLHREEYAGFLNENHLQERDAWCFEFIVAAFPRAFLERFSGRKNPETGFLEYTIPTLAKSWGFDFCTHHPYTPWWHGNPQEFHEHPYRKMLNAGNVDCPDRYVLLHLLDPWGLRIFHPHRRDIRAERLSHALPAWLNFLRCNEWDYADLFGESTRAMARHAIAGSDPAFSDPVTTRPAICLSMIVRNEAHVIRERLDAVAPYISSWVIVDTGSDDGTPDLIRSHMGRLAIPGELYERPWRDFGHNRSEALTLAQGHGDYIWILDADDILVGTPDFTRLGTSIYWLRCVDDNGDTFWHAQLFRDGLRVRYEGVTHEYAAWEDDSGVGVRLEGDYHIESRCLGARNLDPQKRFARDRDLVLAEVERNPEDARSVFDLAQIYFDARDFVNARKWFARRAEMGGPDEEIYVAMYRLAESMQQLDEPWPDLEAAYLNAWEFRPTRAEPLHAIAQWYRIKKHYQLGYEFAERAAEIPLPEQDTLFVREDVYTWRATDEQAVCASWIGKHAEAFTLNRRLLARPDIPDQVRQRIARNRDFSVPAMIEAASSYPNELVGSLAAGPPDAEVTISLVAGPDQAATEQTLNSFLHCCTDLSRVERFLVLDTGLSAQDRAILGERYGFLEFAECGPGDGPGAQFGQLRAQIHGRFWLHLGQGWRFFAPENFITRLTAVLDAEAGVFQVSINFADAAKLTGTCAAEQEVHRAPDAGRYLLTEVVASGPAMFDTARLDRAGGLDRTDPDPIAALGRRAAAAALQTASLDEVLCITAN
jgi:glycosyltransferase involved in cell wall biosynthesis